MAHVWIEFSCVEIVPGEWQAAFGDGWPVGFGSTPFDAIADCLNAIKEAALMEKLEAALAKAAQS